MKVTLCLFLAFSAGMAFQKWDAKHGAEWGYAAGRWTRIHVLGLQPIERDGETRGQDD